MESDSFTPLWQDKDDRQLRMAIQKSLQDQEGRDLTTLEPIDPRKRMREKSLYGLNSFPYIIPIQKKVIKI